MSDPASETTDDHREPVAVAAFADLGEAEVTIAKLRAFDIEARVSDESEGGVLPVEGDVLVQVLVRAIDADAAREILAGDPQAEEAAEPPIESAAESPGE
jgi:hypothetical protein